MSNPERLTPSQTAALADLNSMGWTATVVAMDDRYAIVRLGLAGWSGSRTRLAVIGPTGHVRFGD